MFFLLIIGCDSVGILISLVLPAVQAARESGRRAQCMNNLKTVGLAMQGYHRQYGCFPPSFIADKDGKPMHSWRVLLLPFLGRQDLYAQYRYDEPWNSPHNGKLGSQMPVEYLCPSDLITPTQTSYVMVVGPHAISDGHSSRCLSDIKKDPAKAIMVVETAASDIHWMEPGDLITEDISLFARTTQPDIQREKSPLFRKRPAECV